MIWEIKSKDDFDVRHISIPNPIPFITIELEPDGTIPENAVVPENAKLRLVSNTHISPQSLKKSIDIAKKNFKPESVTVHNRPGKRISVEEISNTLEEDNLRDLKIQESLIKEYLKDYKLDQDIENKILELNKKYNLMAEQTEEVARNVNWKLRKIEWNNLFNFGEGNSINFENLNGLLGIFGKNYTGKSSTIDSILWTIFNSVSKKARKNVDIINQNKDKCNSKIELEIGNKIYTVEREAIKYLKKLYGEETVEAKTTLNFSVEDIVTGEKENLNAEDRNGTDANIRKVFGTIDDFLLTSMTSQMGAMNYIEEGSTKRKEILGKFLDLEMFDKKFKLAKDDSTLLKGAMKRLEGKNFDEEIEEAKKCLSEAQNLYKNGMRKADEEEHVLRTTRDEMSKINGAIESGPKQEFIEIDKIEEELTNLQDSLKKCVDGEISFIKQLKEYQTIVSNTEKLIQTFDIAKLKEDKSQHDEAFLSLNIFLTNIKILNKEKEAKKQKIAILDTVPCGDSFPSCRYLVDANKQKAALPKLETELWQQNDQATNLSFKIEHFKKSIADIEQYQTIKEKLSTLQSQVSDLELRKEKNKNMFKNFESQKVLLESKRILYFENEESMKELSKFKKQKIEIAKEIERLELQKSTTDQQVMNNFGIQASSEKEIEMLTKQKKELADLRDEYLAYDLFSRCMHSNGIVYDIIKKKLPIINQEISKNLANIVSFEIFFEDDGKKLDIFIRHPKYESRPIELCSGAEKTIASMAIRLALIKVSSLPVGDLFILDEPATALDEDNMEGFTRILDMIKSQFKTVIIISHLDALKDAVDDQIIIEKVDGYAKINL